MQALLEQNMGIMMMIALGIYYLYASRIKSNDRANHASPLRLSSILSLSGFVISAFIIVFSLEPTKGIGAIPLELIIFLGYVFIQNLSVLISPSANDEQTTKVAYICTLAVVAIALLLSIIGFFKQEMAFPSFLLSFKAYFEIFKNPLTGLFGAGLDNYTSVFYKVKDVAYNQTNLWQMGAPAIDRSGLLHIATTAGFVGLATFVYFLISWIKTVFAHSENGNKQLGLQLSAIFLLSVIVFFSPSFMFFFLLFFLASQATKKSKEYLANLSKSFSLYTYVILIITASVFFGSIIRAVGSFFIADISFAQSMDAMNKTTFNVKTVFDAQQKALINNPFLPVYHVGYSQLNVVLANNIMEKSATGSADQKSLTLTKEDKQTLINAIQSAIAENQTAIELAPKKAEYWAQLGQIYTLIPKELRDPKETEANSPLLAASTYYKKALELDPKNPAYYFALGQISLNQKKSDEGLKFIKKAIEMKPNWANAHYQLGIMYANNRDMKNATKELETALSNIDQKTSQAEYDAVKKTLDQIKNPQGEQQAPQGAPAQ